MKDEQLAQLAAEGNTEALDLLVRRHRRQMRRWALFVLGRIETAEDATQEALVRLMRSIGSYDPGRSFLPWLRALVHNAAIDHQRRAHRADHKRALQLPPASGPEDRLDARRGVRLAQQAFEQLPPRQREAYFGCEVQGRRASEIATDMGIEAATVRALLHQARRHIRRAILRPGGTR